MASQLAQLTQACIYKFGKQIQNYFQFAWNSVFCSFNKIPQMNEIFKQINEIYEWKVIDGSLEILDYLNYTILKTAGNFGAPLFITLFVRDIIRILWCPSLASKGWDSRTFTDAILGIIAHKGILRERERDVKNQQSLHMGRKRHRPCPHPFWRGQKTRQVIGPFPAPSYSGGQ